MELTAQSPTLISPFSETWTGKAVLALGASLFVAACAHISLPLPFTPVPLTFSDLAVLLVGLALGPEIGFAALALYLAEGAAGLPVFSPLGLPGIARFAGPTAGYLLAYPFAAALAGFLAQRLRTLAARFPAALAAAAVASAFIMLCGTLWLGVLLHLSADRAILQGAAPFLPGQIVKVLAAAGIVAAFPPRRKA